MIPIFFLASACAGKPVELGAGDWKGAVASEDDARYRPVVGTAGIVSADDRLAAEWGTEILRRGGNAVDAAVAVEMMMAVTRPHYASLGGGGFAVLCMPGDAACAALDFRERAPGAAHRGLYIQNGKANTDLSQNGALASGVPGIVAGMKALHSKYGKLPWMELFKRPIAVAREGSVMTSHMEAVTLERWFAMNTPAREIWGCRAGRETERVPCLPGTRIRQSDLARVLEEVSRKGPDGFYKGWVARKLVQGIRAGGGIFTEKDLSDYEPKWRAPVVGKFHDWEIVTMPPPSSGGAILLQLLGYTEIAETEGELAQGWGSVDTLAAMGHAMDLAFEDRAKYFGDPDFVRVPVSDLISLPYLRKQWRGDAQMFPFESEPGSPVGAPVSAAGMNTTHFSVFDKDGGAVAITVTVNDNFGSGFVPPGTGIVMNNQMDDFSVQPGVPNLFGLVGAEANAIAPGKRPLSSMTPTLVRDKDGIARIAIGAQGGPRIITSVYQALVARLRFRMALPDAVVAPRIHAQWKPERLSIERHGFSPEVIDGLRSHGFVVKEMDYAGKIHAAERFPNGRVWGVSDPRTEGAAVAE